MARIAQVAKVSQGCMRYHFPAKSDAIKAAINYLYAKRLTDHKRDLDNIPQGTDRMAHSIDVYWHHLNEDHFTAYQELVIAARTDKELSKSLQKAYKRFVKAWRKDAVDLISEKNNDREKYELICDIGQCQMEGLAFGRLNDQISDEQTRKVLAFTKDLLVRMVSELEIAPTR